MASIRPRVSRDTRWLLIIVVASLVTLSMLARIRFSASARITGPIAPVLSQIGSRPALEDITESLEILLPRLRTVVVPVAIDDDSPRLTSPRSLFLPALRFRDGFGVALQSPNIDGGSTALVAMDVLPVSSWRVPANGATPIETWAPRDPGRPRFLIAVGAVASTITLRPMFVGALHEIADARWPSPVWLTAGAAGVAAGSVVFTLDGIFAGLITDVDWIDGHVCTVTAVPIGVDYDRIQGVATDPHLAVEQKRLRTAFQLAAPIIGLGLDRLDYTKGIPERLEARDRLFVRRPDLCGQLTFVQVGVPSRSSLDSYSAIESAIDRKVEEVNARHSRPGLPPPIYYHKAA